MSKRIDTLRTPETLGSKGPTTHLLAVVRGAVYFESLKKNLHFNLLRVVLSGTGLSDLRRWAQTPQVSPTLQRGGIPRGEGPRPSRPPTVPSCCKCARLVGGASCAPRPDRPPRPRPTSGLYPEWRPPLLVRLLPLFCVRWSPAVDTLVRYDPSRYYSHSGWRPSGAPRTSGKGRDSFLETEGSGGRSPTADRSPLSPPRIHPYGLAVGRRKGTSRGFFCSSYSIYPEGRRRSRPPVRTSSLCGGTRKAVRE